MANASAEMKAKADIFHALHQAPGAFIIPNPWDRGTARILAYLGFKALARVCSRVRLLSRWPMEKA